MSNTDIDSPGALVSFRVADEGRFMAAITQLRGTDTSKTLGAVIEDTIYAQARTVRRSVPDRGIYDDTKILRVLERSSELTAREIFNAIHSVPRERITLSLRRLEDVGMITVTQGARTTRYRITGVVS